MTTPTVETPAPIVMALPPSPFVACDAHAEPNTQALFEIALPKGGHLMLCAHHARKHFGVNAPTWLHQENKTEGSDH